MVMLLYPFIKQKKGECLCDKYIFKIFSNGKFKINKSKIKKINNMFYF